MFHDDDDDDDDDNDDDDDDADTDDVDDNDDGRSASEVELWHCAAHSAARSQHPSTSHAQRIGGEWIAGTNASAAAAAKYGAPATPTPPAPSPALTPRPPRGARAWPWRSLCCSARRRAAARAVRRRPRAERQSHEVAVALVSVAQRNASTRARVAKTRAGKDTASGVTRGTSTRRGIFGAWLSDGNAGPDGGAASGKPSISKRPSQVCSQRLPPALSPLRAPLPRRKASP
jgi:hypothetical protein